MLIAACFTLGALVITAEPGRQFLRARKDIEGIERATGIRIHYDPSPLPGWINLSAQDFIELSPSEEVGPGRPFVEPDCVSIEPSDSLLNLLGPHLAREPAEASSDGPGILFDGERKEAFFVEIPAGVEPWQGSPANLATWFFFWDGLRDPHSALRILPRSLSWFEVSSLDARTEAGLVEALSASRFVHGDPALLPRLGEVDLIPLLESRPTLPTQLISLAGPDSRCQSILSDSFYLVQLRPATGSTWRAVFVLPVGRMSTGPEPTFLLERMAVFEAHLEKAQVTTDWQRQVAEQASTGWKPGSSAESFPELVELTRGIDSMLIDQVALLLDNLERQAEASQGRVSVASVDLPAQLAATWGLGVVLVLQLYLHLHVLRLRHLVHGAPGPWVSWIGLFPGSFSRIATAVSISIPPFACIAAIVTASVRGDISGEWWVRAAFSSSPLVSLALGVWTSVTASRLAEQGAAGRPRRAG